MTIKLVYFKNFFCNKESDKILREVDLPICKVFFSVFTKIYFYFILFYVRGYSAYMHEYVLHVYLVLGEARSKNWVPWN